MASMNSAIGVTYSDVENLIYHQVNAFWKRYGGDFDEMVSIANEVFMDVYNTFDPTRGSFSNHLCTCIYNRLVDACRTKTRTFNVWGVSADVDNGAGKAANNAAEHRCGEGFDLAKFAEGLTEDAKMVLGLALEPSQDIETIANGKGGSAKNWSSTIRNHLYDLGWTSTRIRECFSEIREVLKG